MTLRVNFDITTKPNDDQILTQMRYLQAESQLPQEVRNYGVTIKKSTTSPLALFSLYLAKWDLQRPVVDQLRLHQYQ